MKSKSDTIIEQTALKTLEYLEKGVPATGANGEPLLEKKKDGSIVPVRKAPSPADLRAFLAVAKECERTESKTGGLGNAIRNRLGAVKERTAKLKLTGTDPVPIEPE